MEYTKLIGFKLDTNSIYQTQKQINYDDGNAARFVDNIKGWVDINNRFYGNDQDSEHMARWSSCTHTNCDCGKPMTKSWTKCDDCRFKSEIERYNQLQFKIYNGDMVYSHLADKYFSDSDEIEEYCYDEDIEPNDLMLVFCEPKYFNQICSDYWEDILPEEYENELPSKLQEALDNLNQVITSLPPVSYYPSKTRTLYRNV